MRPSRERAPASHSLKLLQETHEGIKKALLHKQPRACTCDWLVTGTSAACASVKDEFYVGVKVRARQRWLDRDGSQAWRILDGRIFGANLQVRQSTPQPSAGECEAPLRRTRTTQWGKSAVATPPRPSTRPLQTLFSPPSAGVFQFRVLIFWVQQSCSSVAESNPPCVYGMKAPVAFALVLMGLRKVSI